MLDNTRDNADELAALWHLWAIRGVRHDHLVDLTERVDLCDLWALSDVEAAQHLKRAGFTDNLAEGAIERIREHPDPRRDYERERQKLPDDARLLHVGQAAYPERLLDLEEPPTFLYLRGTPEVCRGEDALAVVGSRDVTVEDARFARQIVGDVAAAGVQIVSGGAFGVDRVAHEAALQQGTPTLVLLPSGLDCPTPRSNEDVFRRVVGGGALVTEYPLGTEVRSYHFPRRNRLIAALSDATFIVRAGADSGTMLTAEAAQRIGRPMCVLPGDPREALTEGCLELLVEEAARPVRHGRDILETYFWERGERANQSGGAEGTGNLEEESAGDRRSDQLERVSEEARRLAEQVYDHEEKSGGAVGVDQLAELTGWEASRVQSALLELELYGICTKKAGATAYRF